MDAKCGPWPAVHFLMYEIQSFIFFQIPHKITTYSVLSIHVCDCTEVPKKCVKCSEFCCTAVTSHDVFNWTASVLQPHSLSARNLSAEFADNPWTLTSSKAKRKLGFIFKSKQESKTTFCWSVNVRCTAPLVDGKQNSARDVTEWRFCWPYLRTIHRVFPRLSDTNLIIIFSSILL